MALLSSSLDPGENTEAGVHTSDDIDPNDPVNMAFLVAFEWTQASPQSLCWNEVASKNMRFMLCTFDTSHFEML